MNSFVFPAKIAAHNPAPPYSEKEGHRRRPSYPSVSSPEQFLLPATPTRSANALPRFNASPPRRKVDHFRRSSTHSFLSVPLRSIFLCLAVLLCIVITTIFPLNRLFSPRHSPRIVPARSSTQYVDTAFVPEPKLARKPRIPPGRKERPFPGQQENRRGGSVNNPVLNSPQRLPSEDRPVVVVKDEKVVEKVIVDEVLVKMAKEGGIQEGRYRGAPLPLNQIVPGQLRAGKKLKQKQPIPSDQLHDHPLPVSPPSKDGAAPKRRVMQFGKVKGKAATRAALLLQNRKEAFAAERELLEEEGSVEGEQVGVDASGNEVRGTVTDGRKGE